MEGTAMDYEEFLPWNDKYLIGIQQFDIQHKGLFQKINEIYYEFSQGTKAQDLRRHLNYLYVYTINHFVDEEDRMAEMNYEGLKEHREAHEVLKKRVQEYMDKINDPDFPIEEFMVFLSNWLKNHVIHMDMLYRDFVQKNKK